MGFPTKVQTIKRKGSEQWYINFPSALAQACEFGYGENVEWILEDRFTLTLKRAEAERTEIGRASGRERGEISVGAVSLKKKKKKIGGGRIDENSTSQEQRVI